MKHKTAKNRSNDISPQQTIAALQSAVNLYCSGRYSDGLAAMKELLNRQPANTDAMNIAAACAQSLGKMAEAETLFKSAIRLEPHRADAHNNLGLLLHGLNRFSEAEASYRSALAARADYPEACFNIALLYQATNRLDEAEQAYRRALEIRPEYAEAHMNLAAIFKATNRLTECEAAYRSAVAVRPGYAQAHNHLGLLLQQLKRFAEAETAYHTALAMQSDYADAQCNLGSLFMELGLFPNAETALRKALALNPALFPAAHNLGKLLHALKRHTEAESAYRHALSIKPDSPDALCDLGNLLGALDRMAEAVACYRGAIAVHPGHANACFNLGNLFMAERNFCDAEAAYRDVLRCDPDQVETLNNLGLVLRELRRFAEAELAYRRALAVRPDYPDAYNNLGLLLVDQRRAEEAEAAYRQALAISPDFAEAHNNLGLLLMDLGRAEEAESAYRQALHIRSDFSEAHNNLGILLMHDARFSEAESAFRAAVACKPDHAHAIGQIDHVRRHQCAWSSLAEGTEAIISCLDSGHAAGISPFSLLAIPEVSPYHLRQAGKLFAEKRFSDSVPNKPARKEATPKGRLRIGYLSADFHEHATALLLAGVLDRHDRNLVSIYAYSYGPHSDAPIRHRLASACEHFRDLRPIGDVDAAKRIAEDGIDILVDLKGYTEGARLGITALRPVPVIVSWLGYPGTLGDARLADFLIGDPVVTPLAHADHFSETLALMPHCYQPTDCERVIGEKPTRAEAGLPESGFIFCSFNQSYKFNPEMFSLWCRLLAEVPHSILWLLEPSSSAIANLRMEARVRQIDPDRLVFAPKLPQADHLGRLQLADLALDTFPCTSHTTGSDALWAGVPLVTKIGETFASRVAASLLHAVNLPELVAESDAAYFDLARSLALHPARLAAMRQKLQTNRSTSALFDTKRFTRDLERLYFEIWAQQARGTNTSFALSPSVMP